MKFFRKLIYPPYFLLPRAGKINNLEGKFLRNYEILIIIGARAGTGNENSFQKSTHHHDSYQQQCTSSGDSIDIYFCLYVRYYTAGFLYMDDIEFSVEWNVGKNPVKIEKKVRVSQKVYQKQSEKKCFEIRADYG